MLTVASSVWLAWMACGAWLEYRKRRNLAHVRHRILVTGMRGKTTFVRLLHAGLVQHGVPTLSRISGDAPLLLLPDGRERPSPRRGLPNIVELQRVLLGSAVRGVEAVVLENMAIRPDLQRTVGKYIFRPTLQVLVSDAPDHLDVFPAGARDRAVLQLGALDKGIPLLITPGEENGELRSHAVARGFELVEPEEGHSPTGLYPHTRNLLAGVMAALRTMNAAGPENLETVARRAREDERIDIYTTGEGFRLADLLSVNDPLSTSTMLRLLAERAGVTPQKAGAVYCHRRDRAARLQSFVSLLRRHPAVIVGDRPPLTVLKASGARYLRRLDPRAVPGEGFAFAAGNAAYAGARVRQVFRSMGEHARW